MNQVAARFGVPPQPNHPHDRVDELQRGSVAALRFVIG
jgi:hypothetical protein